MLTLARAQLALLTGDPAKTLLECARCTSGRTVGLRIHLEALLLEASASAELENAGHALTSWRHATTSADAAGMAWPFALLPHSCVDTLIGAGATAPRTWPRAQDLAVFPDSMSMVELTERERAVLTELARGLSRNEIAAKLFVSPNTIKTQTASLFRKLGARTRDEALTTAAKLAVL